MTNHEPPAEEVRPGPPAAGLARTWALGAAALFLLAVLAVSGLILAFYYRPTTDQAYLSLVDLREVSVASLVRPLHRWGSHLLVAVVWLHLLRVFLNGAYRLPRRRNWLAGVVLLLLTLAFAHTGALLPRDQAALWGPSAVASPFVAPPAAPSTEASLLGAYAVHCLLLPLLLTLVLLLHLRWTGNRPRASS